ncbi:uncharacterized protein [Centruroides vittatus]|uniref:uncharacterized protein n=1 Tax=Centruroides vittatus TaxID=120091 RepID=UPI0035107CE3
MIRYQGKRYGNVLGERMFHKNMLGSSRKCTREQRPKLSVGTTEGFFVNAGLHQRSILSPYLFDLIMDVLVCDVKCEAPWSMLFADDIVLCELSQTKAKKKQEDWRKVLEERGLKISRTKTAYMTLNGREKCKIKIQNAPHPLVQSFKYLRTFVEMGGGLNSEVQHRIQCGWINWRKLSGVLCGKKVSCNLKGKLYKSVVRPAMLYEAETRAITRAQETKMEVVEMRMLRWTCGVGSLSKKMQECKSSWFGHVERRSDNYGEKKIGKLIIKGKRKRRRSKMRWKDKVEENFNQRGLKREEALDREK